MDRRIRTQHYSYRDAPYSRDSRRGFRLIGLSSLKYISSDHYYLLGFRKEEISVGVCDQLKKHDLSVGCFLLVSLIPPSSRTKVILSEWKEK